MKHLLALLLLVNSVQAQELYGRFWRGKALEKMPEQTQSYCQNSALKCFEFFVHSVLVPATVSYSSEKALKGYAPVLLPKSLHQKYFEEVAIVLYNSKENYNKLRQEDPEGKEYGPLHADIFNVSRDVTPQRSNSHTPQKFLGQVEMKLYEKNGLHEVSYETFPPQLEIPEMKGFYRLVELKKGNFKDLQGELSAYLYGLPKEVKGHYVLISENYFMEYIFTEKSFAGSLPSLENLPGSEDIFSTELISLEKTSSNPLEYTSFSYGQGGNAQFTPGKAEGKVRYWRWNN